MSAGTLKVRGCTFYVRSADKTQFAARVHWAPAFIPNAAIAKVLEESCKVQSIVMETSTCKGFEGIPTGICRLVLAGNKDEIPHVFNIVNTKTSERFELLVTISGRSPMCFKCKQTGHYRIDCFTPHCRRCGVYGHTSESCAIGNSYSNSLRGSSKPQSSSTADASIDNDQRYAYSNRGSYNKYPAGGAVYTATRPSRAP